MSTTSNRRRDPGTLTGETVALLVFVLVTLVGGGGLYAAVRLGHQLDGTAQGLPSDPFAVFDRCYHEACNTLDNVNRDVLHPLPAGA